MIYKTDLQAVKSVCTNNSLSSVGTSSFLMRTGTLKKELTKESRSKGACGTKVSSWNSKLWQYLTLYAWVAILCRLTWQKPITSEQTYTELCSWCLKSAVLDMGYRSTKFSGAYAYESVHSIAAKLMTWQDLNKNPYFFFCKKIKTA